MAPRGLILWIALLLTNVGWSQKIRFVPEDSLIGHYDRFSVDNFGRIYAVQNDVIIQFSKELDTLFTGSLKAIRPTSIESSKSFRTLLFDRDRSVILFLDNTLTNIHGEIDLVLQGIQQPILVCESFAGNTIWILDADNLRLIKMNEKLEKVLVTENLTTIFDGEDYPSQMQELNDVLYVLIPGKGIAQFDVFGTYIGLYPCKASSFDVMGEYLFVRSEDKLEILRTEGLEIPEYVYTLPSEVRDFVYTTNHLYLRMDDRIVIGNYKKVKP